MYNIIFLSLIGLVALYLIVQIIRSNMNAGESKEAPEEDAGNKKDTDVKKA